MEVVLDTVVLSHLLRSPRVTVTRADETKRIDGLSTITRAMQKRVLRFVLDQQGGLQTEWEQTCGEEAVKQLINHWDQYSGVKLVTPMQSIRPSHASRRLRQLGFDGTIDKLIIRIALALHERIIVSIDPDFWDPSEQRRVGDPAGSVVSLLRNELTITVIILIAFIRMLIAKPQTASLN